MNSKRLNETYVERLETKIETLQMELEDEHRYLKDAVELCEELLTFVPSQIHPHIVEYLEELDRLKQEAER